MTQQTLSALEILTANGRKKVQGGMLLCLFLILGLEDGLGSPSYLGSSQTLPRTLDYFFINVPIALAFELGLSCDVYELNVVVECRRVSDLLPVMLKFPLERGARAPGCTLALASNEWKIAIAVQQGARECNLAELDAEEGMHALLRVCV